MTNQPKYAVHFYTMDYTVHFNTKKEAIDHAKKSSFLATVWKGSEMIYTTNPV